MNRTMKLDIARLEDVQCLVDFRCGIPEMDEFIQKGLAMSASHHYCQAYKIKIWPVASS